MYVDRQGHPDSWCIQKVNECYQQNAQMWAFLSNLKATISEVHVMAGAVAAEAGGTAPDTPPTLTDRNLEFTFKFFFFKMFNQTIQCLICFV